ncbi:MAG: ATP-grasp domain-containing protein [Oscillospiraceae bacterium]|nr:ATP-grasp domain-containing protein [Oscillospiraceae bacterium]
MTAFLVYEREGAKRNRDYIKLHRQYGHELGIDFRLVICDEEHLPEEKCDFAIIRAMRPDITEALEARGIPCFNGSFVSKICNNKARTYEYLDANGVPVIPWISAKSEDSPPEIASYPCVIKPCCGHGGKNVRIIRNDEEYASARRDIAPDEYVIQPLATTLGRDMRVYILGGKAVAAVLRTSEGDFRSNFSLGGKVEAVTLSKEEETLIEKVCSLFDFALCGIDIMYHNGRPVINEIEDVVGSRMLYKTHDIDILKLYLEYILKRLSAE